MTAVSDRTRYAATTLRSIRSAARPLANRTTTRKSTLTGVMNLRNTKWP